MADEPVIVWNMREPLGGRTPSEFEAELKRLLAGRVEAAYVFGSYGTPRFNRDSDIDLFLIARTEKSFLERALDFAAVWDLAPDMDLLVYTPEEFAELTREPTVGFWRSAVASMRRLL